MPKWGCFNDYNTYFKNAPLNPELANHKKQEEWIVETLNQRGYGYILKSQGLQQLFLNNEKIKINYNPISGDYNLYAGIKWLSSFKRWLMPPLIHVNCKCKIELKRCE
jgi:hypothetical protein